MAEQEGAPPFDGSMLFTAAEELNRAAARGCLMEVEVVSHAADGVKANLLYGPVPQWAMRGHVSLSGVMDKSVNSAIGDWIENRAERALLQKFGITGKVVSVNARVFTPFELILNTFEAQQRAQSECTRLAAQVDAMARRLDRLEAR